VRRESLCPLNGVYSICRYSILAATVKTLLGERANRSCAPFSFQPSVEIDGGRRNIANKPGDSNFSTPPATPSIVSCVCLRTPLVLSLTAELARFARAAKPTSAKSQGARRFLS
jgi:hypothetical protein